MTDAVAIALLVAIPATVTPIAAAFATIRAGNKASVKTITATTTAAAETHTLVTAGNEKLDENRQMLAANDKKLDTVHAGVNGNLERVSARLDEALREIQRLNGVIAEFSKGAIKNTFRG